jgi:hypothetical protein
VELCVYLVYFTDSYVTSVKASYWKIRDGKFLIFYIGENEVAMYNFNNIYGFCQLSEVNLGERM